MKKNKKERIAERLEILQKSRSTYDDNAQFRLKQIEARANHIRAIEERRRLETITTYLYEYTLAFNECRKVVKTLYSMLYSDFIECIMKSNYDEITN